MGERRLFPEFLAGQRRVQVASHVGLGGALCVMLFEIHDFILLRRLFRPEVATALAEAMERELRRVVAQRLSGLPVCLVERLEPSRVLVLAGGNTGALEDVDRACAALRLETRVGCGPRPSA